jgi:hypothetical protein
MGKNQIKIYGERNTGTNYLIELISRNFNINVLNGVAPDRLIALENLLHSGEVLKDFYFYFAFGRTLGWKHSSVKSPKELAKYKISRNTYFITLSKNPYSWLLSLYKNPYHYKGKVGTFEEFIETPYKNVKRENTGKSSEYPVNIWNIKNKSYIGLNNELKIINLKYEELLIDPEKTINKIKMKFNLELKNSTFVNVTDSTKGASSNFSSYQEYYLNEKWKDNKNLTPNAISIINKMLDYSIMQHYGYNKI